MATTTKIQATASKYGNSGNNDYTNHGRIYVAKQEGGSTYRTRLTFPSIRSLAAIGDANIVITKVTLHVRRDSGGPAVVTAGCSADGAWGAVTEGSGSATIAAQTAWHEIDITDCAEEILNYPGTWYLHLTGTGTRVRCNGAGSDWTPYINVVWWYSANTLTTDAESVELGKAARLNIAPEAGDARFELSYQFGDESGTIANTASTSVTWTPPVQLATEIPNADSGEVKITMKVYDASGKQLRTEVLYLTVTVPETAVPTITDAGIRLVNALGGYALTGKTYATIAPVVNINGAYGATVKSVRATVTDGGSTQDIVWSAITETDAGVFNGAAQNTSIFANSGKAVIEVTVTDSRGREVTHTSTISVQAYANPIITEFAVERYEPVYNDDELIAGYAPSDVGENVWVTLKASCSDVAALNKITWKLTAKTASVETVYSGGGDSAIINLANDREVITAVVSTAATVEYAVEVFDTAGYTAYQYDSVTPGRANFALAASKYGASFGCLPKGTERNPMLESAYPFYAYGGIADFGGSVQSGLIYEIDGIAGGEYLDTVVTFEKTFAAPPTVACTIYSDSVSAKYGLITVTVVLDSVSETGFTVRCYNGDTSKRFPRVKWIAIGATAISDAPGGDGVVPAGALLDSAGYSLVDSNGAMLAAADAEGTVQLSYTGAQIDSAIGRVDNHSQAIEALQRELDNLETDILSCAAQGWPLVSPNGTLYNLFVNDDGTLRVDEYQE